jgi:hypothetical protein
MSKSLRLAIVVLGVVAAIPAYAFPPSLLGRTDLRSAVKYATAGQRPAARAQVISRESQAGGAGCPENFGPFREKFQARVTLVASQYGNASTWTKAIAIDPPGESA